MENVRNFKVWENWASILVFENHIITYLCILFLNFNALSCSYIFFFKNCVFFLKFNEPLQFRLIQSIFRSIKILLNCLRKPLSVSINRNCFEIFLIFFYEPLSVLIDQNCFSILQNS